MIGLLISVLILCLILGLVIYLFNNIPILAPFAWLANVICVVTVSYTHLTLPTIYSV